METVIIDSRFRGPDHSGNGGYVAGVLGERLGACARVRLAAPPPLDHPLKLSRDDSGLLTLCDGDRLIASGTSAELELDPPQPPSAGEVAKATAHYAGFEQQIFPHCFVCGPLRKEHDGLRIFAGAVDGTPLFAAPWVPDENLAEDGIIPPRFIWAALDCPSAFANWPDTPGKLIVLGDFCVRVDRPLKAGTPCRVVSWPAGVDGRKRHAGSALYDEHDQLIACAKATWIELDIATFRGA